MSFRSFSRSNGLALMDTRPAAHALARSSRPSTIATRSSLEAVRRIFAPGSSPSVRSTSRPSTSRPWKATPRSRTEHASGRSRLSLPCTRSAFSSIRWASACSASLTSSTVAMVPPVRVVRHATARARVAWHAEDIRGERDHSARGGTLMAKREEIRAMQDAWRAYLDLALGFTEASRKRATKVARRVVGKGGATAEQLQGMAEDLVKTSLANRESLARLVRYEIDRALGRVGLATAEEVADLTSRVRDLEQRMREAEAAAAVASAAARADVIAEAVGTDGAAQPTAAAQAGSAPVARPAKKAAPVPAAPVKKAASPPVKKAAPAKAVPTKAVPAKAVPAKAVPAKAVPAKAVAKKTVAKKAPGTPPEDVT